MKKLLILFCLLSFDALASNMWCTGKITNLYIDSSNIAYIKGSWRNDYTAICDTEGKRGVTAVTCSLWISLATASMTDDKQVTLMYNDNNGSLSCSTLPIYYNSPTPSYLMLVK